MPGDAGSNPRRLGSQYKNKNMKTIYMNQTLNWLHQKGIKIEVGDNVKVTRNDTHIVIEEVNEITEAQGIQNANASDESREPRKV